MSSQGSANETTAWVPICCENVMRHNSFKGGDGAPVATLVCTCCGKHLTLQPHTSGPLDQYGEGARLLQFVGVSRPFRSKAGSASAANPAAEDTM